MLNTIDVVIAFAVIMSVLSLLITIIVQMVSAAFSLRGKNLANALALTFQTIDPKIGDHAHSLAAQILRDPIFSDSIWRPKHRPAVIPDPSTQALIDAEKKLQEAEKELAADLKSPGKQAAVDAARQEVNTASTGATARGVTPNRMAPWGFFSKLKDATALGGAIRPGEIYRIINEFAELTPTEAALRDIPPDLIQKSIDLLDCLRNRDQPAKESESKLKVIRRVADIFSTHEQQKAVLDSLANFGATVERATTEAYDRFQRWFGSAQDRAEQWFQTHVRIVTIICSICAAFLLQLDTAEIYRQLRDQPKLVEALVKSAPTVLQQGEPVTDATDTQQLLKNKKEAVDVLRQTLDEAGFDIVPHPFFGRWDKDPTPTWARALSLPRPIAVYLAHFIGILATAGLLALGAPFWFNLLKNLTSLRPALATLIEKRPTSAPALRAAPSSPPFPS